MNSKTLTLLALAGTLVVVVAVWLMIGGINLRKNVPAVPATNDEIIEMSKNVITNDNEIKNIENDLNETQVGSPEGDVNSLNSSASSL